MGLPSSPAADRVLGIDDGETELVLDALSPESARRVLAALDEGPATASELAGRTDLTPQNVSYHLEKLTGAELVRAEGSRGSGGNAATVYAPAKTTLVSTATDATPDQPRIGALMFAAGVLLTLVCVHSIVEPAALLELIGHGLGHLFTPV